MSTSSRAREQGRSRGASSNPGLGVKHPQQKKSPGTITSTKNLLESLTISDSTLNSKSRGRSPRSHDSTRSGPSFRIEPSAISTLQGARSHMDRVASNPVCRANTTSSSSLQSMAAESTSEDNAFGDNNLLSLNSEHHVGPRRADYVRGRKFLIDLHAEIWIDPSVSGHPEARTHPGLERDLVSAHDREVSQPLPRMRRYPDASRACWLLHVMQDEDGSSPRDFHSTLFNIAHESC